MSDFLGNLDAEEAEFLLTLAYPVRSHPHCGRKPTKEGDGVFPFKEDSWPRGGHASTNDFFYDDNLWWPPHSENQYEVTPEEYDGPHGRTCLLKLAHENDLDTGMYYAPLDGEYGIPEEWWLTDAQAG